MKIQTLIWSSIFICRTLLGLDLFVYYHHTGGGLDPINFINDMITAVAPTATLLWIDTYFTEASLVTAIGGAGFSADVLLVFNGGGDIWSVYTGTIIGNALTSGKISKLIVWDAQTELLVSMPDLDGIFTHEAEIRICPIIDSVPPSTGVASEVGCWDGNAMGLYPASTGSITSTNMVIFQASHPEAVAYYKSETSQQAMHVHYCYNGADIMYSTTPMEINFWVPYQKAVDYFINTMDLLVGGSFCAGIPVNLCGPNSCVFGDENDADQDNDGIPDICDKCPGGDDNLDSDNDGIPDACDICPFGNNYIDNDNDGVPDCIDNCVGISNPDQINSDNDSFGDACDNCVWTTNEDQADGDNNNIGDECDYCCANDCSNLPNGKYQSCDTCHGFIKCSNGNLYNYQCAGNTVYDANAQNCRWVSTTCPIPGLPYCV